MNGFDQAAPRVARVRKRELAARQLDDAARRELIGVDALRDEVDYTRMLLELAEERCDVAVQRREDAEREQDSALAAFADLSERYPRVVLAVLAAGAVFGGIVGALAL